MSAAVRQLPVKSLRWTANLLLSTFLTWTTLNYFIQPQQLLDTIRRLAAGMGRVQFKAVVKLFARPIRRDTLVHISA